MPPPPMWHVLRPVLLPLTLVALLATTLQARADPLPAGDPDLPTAPQSLVDGERPTMIWGATARPRGDESWTDAVVNLEEQVGRQVVATRIYLSWDSYFPNDLATWIADTGHLPLISINSKETDGTPVLWRDIASAQPGSGLYDRMIGWANRIKAYDVPVYFTFNHEPEAAGSDAFGTDREFVAAWRKMITIFRGQGVTNAKYLWIMTGWSFWVDAGDPRQAIKWYPGDAYVDALGSDEYNDYTCRDDHDSTWKSLAEDIEPFRQFGLAHPAKELWLPEYGSFEDPAVPGRKGQWVDDVRDMFKIEGYEQFRGIVYFHSYRVGTPCEWWIDSSSSSLKAFRAMGQDVFYADQYGPGIPPSLASRADARRPGLTAGWLTVDGQA